MQPSHRCTLGLTLGIAVERPVGGALVCSEPDAIIWTDQASEQHADDEPIYASDRRPDRSAINCADDTADHSTQPGPIKAPDVGAICSAFIFAFTDADDAAFGEPVLRAVDVANHRSVPPSDVQQ